MAYDTLDKAPADTAADVPAAGDVILHPVLSHVTNEERDQVLVVLGSKVVPLNDDPSDSRTITRVHAYPIGWKDEMYAVPATHPVPVVSAGQYADLVEGQYRRP